MKKLLCLSLALCMVLLCAPIVHAETGETDEPLEVNTKVVDRFFEKDFKVFDREGVEITEEFYAAVTEPYQRGDYVFVYTYLKEHVHYAEAREVWVSGARASRQTVRVTRDVYAVVDDEIHGYAEWNSILGYADLTYIVDTNQGEIVSASTPVVRELELSHQHGDAEPTFTVTNKRAKVASDKLSADFSFHVKAEEMVRADWADGVNQMQLAFRYQSDFDFTEYVDY